MQNKERSDNKFDYDVISIPGGPIGYEWVTDYAADLLGYKEAPIIISGSIEQTDFLDSALKNRGVDPKLVINETDILKKYYRIGSDEKYRDYEPRDTMQNAYNIKFIMRLLNTGNKVAVVRADYHQQAPKEFEFVFGPGYKIIDHTVFTDIPQIERLLRIGHDKAAIIQSLFLSHKTPGDDEAIYVLDRRIEPIFKKLVFIESALFEIVAGFLKIIKR